MSNFDTVPSLIFNTGVLQYSDIKDNHNIEKTIKFWYCVNDTQE